MRTDRVTVALLEGLKCALAEPGEQPLFTSGKREGLFRARGGVSGEAAARALREGLLEVVRTESKGKTQADWVRPSPRAVQFVHEHESPVQALRDLHAVLQTTRAGIPLWLSEVSKELHLLVDRLTEEAGRWSHRLEALSGHVEEALRRAEADVTAQPDSPAWAVGALRYLDHRRETGAGSECPLPELFAALREHHAGLTLKEFHEGLLRLRERRALRLVPFVGPAGGLHQPEYALPDGGVVLYLAAR
jgi:hypothetical protein